MELSEREIELLDGMIEVQKNHAMRCDAIANRKMAEKQKAWDLERVALLERIKESLKPGNHVCELNTAFGHDECLICGEQL